MIKIYHNNRCSKSRCGVELLEKSGKKYEIIKYLENTPDVDELKNIITLLGISPIDLVRKNEAIWKENFKGKELSDEDIIKFAAKFRPLVLNQENKLMTQAPWVE